MNPLISQILFAFLFITLGFIVGAVIAVTWAERDRKAAPAQHAHAASVPHKAPLAAAPQGAAPVAEPQADAASMPLPVAPPEMALLRDPASGKLAARFDAKLFHTAQELNAAEREQAIKLTREWVAWLGDAKEAPAAAAHSAAPPAATMPQASMPSAVAPAATMPQASMPSAVAPAADTTGHSVGEAHRPAAPAGLTPMAEAQPMTSSQYPTPPVMTPPPPPPPIQQPTQTSTGKGGKAGSKQADAKPAAPVSIVGQIDEILQEMLHRAPADFPGVRLVEDFKNGVVVWVGVEHFYGIDAVTDPRAKELIKAAVAEWERRADRERK